jgi:2-keto-3-deoxy-6-phosphogluconate aldolase
MSVVRASSGQGSMALVMTPRTYEITFAGEAVPAIVAAFEDFDVIVGAGTTTLRAQLPDQAALHGTLDRLMALGLELLGVQAVDNHPFQ